MEYQHRICFYEMNRTTKNNTTDIHYCDNIGEFQKMMNLMRIVQAFGQVEPAPHNAKNLTVTANVDAKQYEPYNLVIDRHLYHKIL